MAEMAANHLCTSITSIRRDFAKDAQNFGAQLEYEVYQRTIASGVFEQVIHERDLVALCGWQSSSIDLLIILGEYMIPIQLKWRRSRRRENHGICNFMKSIQHVQGMLGKSVLFGVWSSRMQPFDDNQQMMSANKVICVSHFDDINGLADKTIQMVLHQLHCHLVMMHAKTQKNDTS